jgi:hypothetical protein
MSRKFLLLVFSHEACRMNHACMYALDLERQGHQVRIILEGEAAQRLRNRQGRFGELFQAALEAGLIAGVCATAARGCATGDADRDVAELAVSTGLPLLDQLDGHAGIQAYVRDGFELVTF